jgi:hypothetical protein
MRDPLSLEDLNRTLLARQLLLDRRAVPVVRALEAVAGIQAQDPVAPLFGLLSRLPRFDAVSLTRALERRSVAAPCTSCRRATTGGWSRRSGR